MRNYMSVLLNVVFIMMAVLLGALPAENLFGKKGMLVYLVASMFLLHIISMPVDFIQTRYQCLLFQQYFGCTHLLIKDSDRHISNME